MEEVLYRQLQKGDEEAVKRVAQESLEFAYHKMYDLQTIAQAMERTYTPALFQEVLPKVESGEHFFEVAVAKEKVIGFSHIGDRGKGWELVRLYLLPEYTGRGIGTALLEHGEGFLEEQGAKRYFCGVRADNKLGTGFFLSHGFIHVPERDKPEKNEWYMEKQL